jgi:hypothetical protein
MPAAGDDRTSRLASEYSRAVAEAISGSTQLMTRAQRIYLDTLGASRTTRSAPDAANLWARWFELGVRSYGQYVTASLGFWNRVAGGVEETLRGTSTAVGASRGTRSVTLLLDAKRGETASASFLVENNLTEAIEIAFDASSFVAETGTVVSEAALRLAPETAHLEAGAEIVVKATIHVSDAFEPGHVYDAVVGIAGLAGREIRIRLDVAA